MFDNLFIPNQPLKGIGAVVKRLVLVGKEDHALVPW